MTRTVLCVMAGLILAACATTTNAHSAAGAKPDCMSMMEKKSKDGAQDQADSPGMMKMCPMMSKHKTTDTKETGAKDTGDDHAAHH